MDGQPDIATRRGASRLAFAVAAAWLAAATAVGATGVLDRLPRPALQLVLFALTLLLLAAGAFVAPVRRWALSLDARHVVALHACRFVGFYFLLLHRQGRLPYAFAVPGGWGDVLVASSAVALAWTVDPAPAAGRRLHFAWNVAGLVDILMVVGTAARLGLADPASMRELAQLPLSLLPTFLVPPIIASHVLLFVLLRRRRRADD